MTLIPKRLLSVAVGPPGGQGRTWDQRLYIKAEIKKTVTGKPNEAKVELYNLAPDSLAFLEQTNHVIQIRAGMDVAGTLFYGEIRKAGVSTKVSHPNQVTTIKALDSRKALVDGYFSGSYPAGTTRSQILSDALAANVLSRGYMCVLPERTYEAPVAFSAPLSKVFDELYTNDPVTWTLEANTFKTYHWLDPQPGNAPLIKTSSGMLGSPTRTPKGVKVSTRFVGSVQIGGGFAVESRLLSGSFRCIQITTKIDTEDEWQDDLLGLAIR